MEKIKVLIVDDSELVRELLTQLLATDDQLSVVGAAPDPYCAREMIKQLNPDVLTLDVEMPRMNGITFLRNLMRLRPMPVVMVSTLTEQGAEVTLEALELGAVDYIAKPKFDLNHGLQQIAHMICAKVKQAARANIAALEPSIAKPADMPQPRISKSRCDLIAIGASTGGTEAIKQILRQLPEVMPPIVIVQHMPAGFTASYAKRLNKHTELSVQELSESGCRLQESNVYIAHGAKHLTVERRGPVLRGVLSDGDPVSRHKPSVDVLFASVAQHLGPLSIGVILTGMGKDGAAGLLSMRQHKALTIAQDEQSSVVWGMPRVAIENHAVEKELPLNDIAACLVDYCYEEQPQDKRKIL